MKNNMLDDYVILNNLDGFRAKLQAMETYCNETQGENMRLNDNLLKREKKYQKLKAELSGLRVDKIRLEAEIVSLKAQLDIYKGFLLAGAHWHQHNNVLVNRPTSNTTIQSIEPKVIPSVAPPPPVLPEGISTQTAARNPIRMDNVLDELRSKIKTINPVEETK